METLYTLITTFIEAIIYIYFLTGMLELKKITISPLKFWLLCFTTYFTLNLSSILLNFPILLAIILIVLITGGISNYIYKNSYLKTTLFNSIFFLYTAISETVLLLFLQISSRNTDVSNQFWLNSNHIIFSILNNIFIFVLSFITTQYKKGIYYESSDNILFTLLCCIEILIIKLLIDILSSVLSLGNHDIAFEIEFIVLLIIFSLLFVNYFIRKVGRNNSNKLKLVQLDTKFENQSTELEHLKQVIKDLRILKHNADNHTNLCLQLLSEKKYNELNDYLVQYSKSEFFSTSLLSTGNPTIDSIVTIMLKEANNLNIDTDYSIYINNTLPIEDIYLNSILSNLFNNAYEACVRIKTSTLKKYIYFEIKTQHNGLYILFENPYDEIRPDPNSNNKLFLSSKRNYSDTGIGLYSIQRIIDLYNGFYSISTNNNIFKINIFIPSN